MFKKLLNKRKNKNNTAAKPPSPVPALDQLHEALQMLEKRERFIRTKISNETQRAKAFAKLKNRKAAVLCLKRKKLYEAQIEQLQNFQLRLHDQMIVLEGAKATEDTLNALKMTASTIKTIQLSLDVDEINQVMEEMVENSEDLKKVGEALATPVGNAAEIDEDELEAELEELEEAELEAQFAQLPPLEANSTANSHTSEINGTVAADSNAKSHKSEINGTAAANDHHVEETNPLQAELAA